MKRSPTRTFGDDNEGSFLGLRRLGSRCEEIAALHCVWFAMTQGVVFGVLIESPRHNFSVPRTLIVFCVFRATLLMHCRSNKKPRRRRWVSWLGRLCSSWPGRLHRALRCVGERRVRAGLRLRYGPAVGC